MSMRQTRAIQGLGVVLAVAVLVGASVAAEAAEAD